MYWKNNSGVPPERERERRPSAAHGVPDAAPAKKRTFGHNF